MRIIWQGTDSLYLVKVPKHKRHKFYYIFALRLFAWIADFFCSEHYACGELVERNLRKFGVKKPIKQHRTKIDVTGISKHEHEGVHALYYLPKKGRDNFLNWLYGWDIVQQLIDLYPDITFIIVDGSQNMKAIYPFIDVLIRPNRHDGHSRMIMECEALGISYIWTQENPTLNYFIDELKTLSNEMA